MPILLRFFERKRKEKKRGTAEARKKARFPWPFYVFLFFLPQEHYPACNGVVRLLALQLYIVVEAEGEVIPLSPCKTEGDNATVHFRLIGAHPEGACRGS